MNKNIKVIEDNGIVLTIGPSWSILEADGKKLINFTVPTWRAWDFKSKKETNEISMRFGKNLVEAIDSGLKLRFELEPVGDTGEIYGLNVEYDDEGETWVTWHSFRNPLTGVVYAEDPDQEVIKLSSGAYYLPMFGRYKPDLGFIVKDAPCGVIDDLFEGTFAFKNKNFKCVYGRFFVSKKGTKMFEVNSNGPHVLIEDDWGGAFSKYRGIETPKKALHTSRNSSHGGGLGVNYYVLPKDDAEDVVDLDDL